MKTGRLLLSAVKIMFGAGACGEDKATKVTGDELRPWLADGYMLAGHMLRSPEIRFMLNPYPNGSSRAD